MSDVAHEAIAPATKPSEFWQGVRAALPVMIGFIPFALLLGAQAVNKNLSVAEVPLMTGLNFAGGSEFAAIELWTSPPHILLIAAVTLLVNSRHILMGMAFAPLIQHLSKSKKLLVLFFMCDESWAMGLADARKKGTRLRLGYYLGIAIPFYLAWVVFTTVGGIIGPAFGDITRYGFDMAFPAVFLVLLAGMWNGVAASRPWLVSLVVAASAYLLLPGAWYVPAGALSGIFAAYFWAEKEHV